MFGLNILFTIIAVIVAAAFVLYVFIPTCERLGWIVGDKPATVADDRPTDFLNKTDAKRFLEVSEELDGLLKKAKDAKDKNGARANASTNQYDHF